MVKSGLKNLTANLMVKWSSIGLAVLVGAFLLSATKYVRADEGDDGDSEAPAASTKHKTAFARERVNKGENKETDGTTAANRFQAETVIKSQYKLDGEQLEVDPD
jgi:hypothetical protein